MARRESPRKGWTGPALIILVALAIRVAHAVSLLRSPVAATLVLDAAFYHEQAGRILGLLGNAGGPPAGFMNVGYPYLLAAAYAVFGYAPAVALAVQAVAGALTAGLLAWTARAALADDVAGLLAGAAYAVYAPAIFYDGLLLTPSLTNLFASAALLGIARYRRHPSVAALALAGLAAGVATFLRSNMALFAVLLAPLALRGATAGVRLPGRRGGRLGPLVLFLGAAALVPASFVVFRGAAHGVWVPTLSANGGMNFWSGNHRGATGLYGATGMVENQNADEEGRVFLEEARRRTDDADLTLAGSSRYWFAEGLREIAAAPLVWLRLEGRKLAHFWSRAEAKTNVSMAFVADFSIVLARAPFGFGLLAVLGVAGLVHLAWQRRGSVAWFAAAPVVVSLATCLAFFVSGEYRHPASLGLCLGAAWLGVETFRAFARARARRRLLAAAVAALLVLPLAARVDPAAARAAHPFVDYANYARAICAPRPDGARPQRSDFRRATALLDRARADAHPQKILTLLDARLWVHTLAALELGDLDAAGRALAVAEELASRDLRPGQVGYSARYLSELRPSVRLRVAALADRPFVARHPELGVRATALLARLDGEP